MTFKKPGTHLSDYGPNRSLNDDVDQGKALPDLVRKKHIYEAHKRMIDLASTLAENSERNNGFINVMDVYRLKSSMYVCFHMFNAMAYKNKLFNLYGKKTYDDDDFELMNHIWIGRSFKNNDDIKHYIKKLYHLIEYIDYCLDELNLTNLLIDNIPFDADPSTF